MDTSLFRRVPPRRQKWKRWAPYGLAVGAPAWAFLLAMALSEHTARGPFPILYAAIFITAWVGGFRPGLLATLLSTAGATWLLRRYEVPPLDFWFHLILFLAAGGLTSWLLGRLQVQKAKLVEKEGQLQDFAENAPIGLQWLGEDGRILWANKAELSLLGYSAEEYLGHNLSEFLVDSATCLDLLKRLQAGEVILDYEVHLRTRSGGIKTVRLNADVFRREGRFIYARCFSRDVTAETSSQRKLAESEQRFRQLAENIKEVFWIWEPATNRCIYVSPMFEEIWGRPTTWIYANPAALFDAVHPDDLPRLRHGFAALTAGTPHTVEYRVLRPDGTMRWVRDCGYPVRNARGEVYRFAGVTEDITDRRTMEQSHLENEIKFRAVFENSLDAIGVACEGRQAFANPAFFRVFGYDGPEELEGKPVTEIIAPSCRQQIMQRLERRMRGEAEPHSYVTRGRRKDASEFDMDVTITIFEMNGRKHALAIMRDVTARRVAEEALRQSERKYRDMVETSADIVWKIDAGGCLTYINPAARQLLGFEPEEMLGRPFLDFIVESHRAGIAGRFQELILEGKTHRIDATARHKDGTLVYLRFTGKRVHDESHRVVGVTGTAADVTAAKRFEEELAAERNLLRTLIDAIPHCIYTKDTESRFIISNQENFRVLGVENEAAVRGQSVLDFCPPDIARRYLADDRTVLRSGEALVDREEPIVLPSGEARTLLTTKLPLRDSEGRITGLVGISRDITEQKRADEALRRSESRLRLAQRIGRIGSWELDLAAQTVLWSEETYRIFGFRSGEVLPSQEAFFNAVHPDDRAEVRERIAQAILSEHQLQFGHRIVRADGLLRYIHQQARVIRDSRGHAISLLGTVQDITERSAAELALQESEQRFRTLFDRSPEAIFLTDPATTEVQLPIIDCNEAACRQYGYGKAELVGKPFALLAPRLRNRRDIEAFRKRLSRDHPVLIQFVCRAKDGRIFPAESRISLITVGGRELILGLQNDITERRAAERAVRRLHEDLEIRVRERTAEFERVNLELESFSYSISHDLRAPLRAINGFAKILQEDYAGQLDTEALRLFKIISQNAVRMGRLIDDLLSFSRLGRQGFQQRPVKTHELVRSVINELTVLEPERREAFVVRNLPEVRGDEAMLRQVFINLLSNALKFTRSRPEPNVQISADEAGDEVVFCVRDNGVGFDMNYAHKLFKVFQRLHKAEEYEGTGAGLAIVDRIVRRHGGRIWAESKLHEGATFFLALPRATGYPASPKLPILKA